MKNLYTLLFAILSTTILFGQTTIQQGHKCFNDGDYLCASQKYQEVLSSGSDPGNIRELIEITEACLTHLNFANQAFSEQDYKRAKYNYEQVIQHNPNDVFVISRIEICDNMLLPPIELSVSKSVLDFESTSEYQWVNVSTNADAYSVTDVPYWCNVSKYKDSFRISCNENPSSNSRSGYLTIKAGDVSKVIYINQKPKRTEILKLPLQNFSVSANGGELSINIESSSAYQIQRLPYWISVKNKFSSVFTLLIDNNSFSTSRNGSLEVVSGNKKMTIYIVQNAAPITKTSTKTKPSKPIKYRKKNTCFNCPLSNNNWGISAAYIMSSLEDFEGFSIGLKYEPLFKYGFGLNTGLNLEFHQTDYLDNYNYYYPQNEFYAINLPLHLEYRLNFYKGFNIYGFGGVGLNLLTDDTLSDIRVPLTLEYGIGIQIYKFQISVLQAERLSDISSDSFNSHDFYNRMAFSLSFMF